MRAGGLHWADEGARRDFAAAGLATLGALAGLAEGEVVSRAATRICRRLPLAGGIYYVKTQSVRARRLPLARWPSYLARGSPLLREARSLRRLRAMGVAAPAPAAWGGCRAWWGMPRLAALVTRELPGYTDLQVLADGDPARARALLPRLEALVASLHRRGLVLGGVKLRNVLADPGGELALLDLPDLRISRAARGRRRDLSILAGEVARHLGPPP